MRMRLFFSCVMLVVSFVSASKALAVQTPSPAPGDSRVRMVQYDPANVVKVMGYYGYQTFILFDQGEKITDLGSGDTEAWAIGVIQSRNGFFIKPKGEKASTNLTVITSHRHYNFDLIQGTEDRTKTPYYMVQFTYPDQEAALLASKAEEERVKSLLQSQSDAIPLNRNYWWDGSEALRPIEAWDNGTFTFLKFAPGRDFPSVFLLNPEDPKMESTVNTHIEGDTIVIHKTATRFILRLGNQATGVWNKSYIPFGVALPGKTISPNIEREVRQ